METRLKRGNTYTLLRMVSVTTKCILFILAIILGSCQYPYEAKIDEKTGLISIDGSIVKGAEQQSIIVSKATSLYEPEFEPYSDCQVQVIDETGNKFNFSESATEPGIYIARINDNDLVYNRSYMARIITPEGKAYESDYETIIQGAPVDSVYYEKEFINVGFDNEDRGLQFYIDLRGEESDSRYYRWKLTETWEIKSLAFVEYIYLNKYFDIEVPSNPMDLFHCWKTLVVPGLYSSSTVNLTSNEKKKIPLHFVSPSTGKLFIKYSLLVEQYSLSPGAYDYWHQSKIESEETGGLYSQQPGQVQSNLHNILDEEEQVLGYFWAAAKTKKRIFVKNQADLNYVNNECEMIVLDKYALTRFPVHVFTDDFGNEYSTINQTCMNCQLKDASSQKPDYWE